MLHRLIPFIVALSLSLAGTLAHAADPTQPQVVDGIEVHLGLIPSATAARDEAVKRAVGKPRGTHHLTISLFDSASGARITEAEVRVRVAEAGLMGREKKLDRIKVADAISFGNYFDFRGSGPYQIFVKVRRKGAETVETKFDYSLRSPAEVPAGANSR